MLETSPTVYCSRTFWTLVSFLQARLQPFPLLHHISAVAKSITNHIKVSFYEQESIPVGSVPSTCRPYPVVSQVPCIWGRNVSTHPSWTYPPARHTHTVGGEYLPLDTPTSRRDLVPEIPPTPRKEMGSEIPTPSPWTDWQTPVKILSSRNYSNYEWMPLV